MSEVTLIPVDPTADEVQYLEDRIYEFNSRATDIADGEPLAFFVRERDRIVAGICGNTCFASPGKLDRWFKDFSLSTSWDDRWGSARCV